MIPVTILQLSGHLIKLRYIPGLFNQISALTPDYFPYAIHTMINNTETLHTTFLRERKRIYYE